MMVTQRFTWEPGATAVSNIPLLLRTEVEKEISEKKKGGGGFQAKECRKMEGRTGTSAFELS